MTPAIRIENLGKSYRIDHASQRTSFPTLRDSLIAAPGALLRRLRNGRARDRREEFWALRQVDLEVQPGEIVGVIGRNGAGKSTLLKILSRITRPTIGRIELTGRVGSLLEVGTGFHPELTGRENVYLNGSILGMSQREIRRHFDEIVDFSGVEKFLDTPVKRYSSGMYVRLAFAVAAHLEPEILIIDEVLAVGDYEFQRKCLKKMESIASGGGRTILFVSHNISAISSLTQNCLYLKGGRVQLYGPTEDVVPVYLDRDYSTSARWTAEGRTDRPFQFLSAALRDSRGGISSNLDTLEDVRVDIEYEVRGDLRGTVVAAILHARDGTLLFSTEDTDTRIDLLEHRRAGRYRSTVKIPGGLLNEGEFYIRLGAGVPGQPPYENIDALSFSLRHTRDHHARGHRKAAYLLPTLEWQVDSIGAHEWCECAS